MQGVLATKTAAAEEGINLINYIQQDYNLRYTLEQNWMI